MKTVRKSISYHDGLARGDQHKALSKSTDPMDVKRKKNSEKA